MECEIENSISNNRIDTSVKTKKQTDIVLIMSDQHNGRITSLFDDSTANTPNLKQLATTSQAFENAYSNCPLCVPSRMSFLSGKHPNQLRIFDNDTILPDEMDTIASVLSKDGYRTVLVGRMHFKGENQHHGFEERYVGDITTQWWGQKRNDLGAFAGTMQMKGCLKEYGFGLSPVSDFDDAVCDAAVDILQKRLDDDRPLFLVIGFYAPHFPYCVEEKYAANYLNKDLHLSDSFIPCHPIYSSMQMEATSEILEHVRPIYYGMIEKLDGMIGKIKTVYDSLPGDSVFIYTSDHGDQIGKRRLYGKQTLYEDSIRIPLLIEDKKREVKVYTQEVSLLDVSKTILDYAGCVLPNHEGDTVYQKNSPIVVSSIIESEGTDHFLQSVIFQRYKLVKLYNQLFLYDLRKDTMEEQDIALDKPEIVEYLSNCLRNDETSILRHHSQQKQVIEEYKAWSSLTQPEDLIRFRFKEEAIQQPKRRSNNGL